MAGFGFARDAINVIKNNRGLLKSKGSPYNNFDKSYITDSMISRKPYLDPKVADPKYLAALNARLKYQNQVRNRKVRWLLVLSISLVAVSIWYILR